MNSRQQKNMEDFYTRGGDGNQSMYSSVEDAQSMGNSMIRVRRSGDGGGNNFQHYMQNSSSNQIFRGQGRSVQKYLIYRIPAQIFEKTGGNHRSIMRYRSTLQPKEKIRHMTDDLRKTVQSQMNGGVAQQNIHQGSQSSRRSMSCDSFGSQSDHVRSVLSLRNARGSVLQQVGGASLTRTTTAGLANQLRRQSSIGSDYFNENI